MSTDALIIQVTDSMSTDALIQVTDSATIIRSTDTLVTAVGSSVAGPTGATGATGAAGSSGVVSVTAPITNSGTSSAAQIGVDQSALTITESQVTNLTSDLALKAPLASPAFSGALTVSGGSVAARLVSQTVTTVTVTDNAATCPVTAGSCSLTNSSAATLTITMATTGAVDGQQMLVRIYDATAVAQTITWVNTEDSSSVEAPTTSNGSTTLPTSARFVYNAATSKWRCFETGSVKTQAAGNNSAKIATTAYADLKVAKAGDTMSGALAMGSNKITGLANGTAATDAVALGQLPSVPTSANQGLLAATFADMATASGTVTLTAGVQYFFMVNVTAPITATKFTFRVNAAASGLTHGFLGLYTQAGALISGSTTADTTTFTAATGYSIPLGTPQTLSVGIYYVGIMFSGTTPPTLIGVSAGGLFLGSTVSSGTLAGGGRALTNGTGLTALLSSVSGTPALVNTLVAVGIV